MRQLQILAVLYLLAVVPFAFIAYTEYQIDQSGLEGWRLTLAKQEGQFDSPLSPVFTVVAFLWGAFLIVHGKGWQYWLARSTAILPLLFLSFLLLLFVSSVAYKINLVTDLGRALRYLTYFFVVPALIVMAKDSRRRLPIPLFVSYLVLSLLTIIPSLDQIQWSSITYARTAIGTGGSASAYGASFLGMACMPFLINGCGHRHYRRRGLGLPFSMARPLGWAVFGTALFCIVITFSRGALLALLVIALTYFSLRSLRRSSNTLVLMIGGIGLVAVALFLDDLLLAALTRQGQLQQLDAGRSEIWDEVMAESSKSLFAFIFGGDRDAVSAPAHNMFLGVLFEHGVLALVCYAGFHASALALLLKWVNRPASPFDLIPKDVGLRMFSVAMGVLFFANFENTFFLNATPMPYLYYSLIGLFCAAQGYAAYRRRRVSSFFDPRISMTPRATYTRSQQSGGFVRPSA